MEKVNDILETSSLIMIIDDGGGGRLSRLGSPKTVDVAVILTRTARCRNIAGTGPRYSRSMHVKWINQTDETSYIIFYHILL